MRSSSQTDGEKPEGHQTKEKPKNIAVNTSGVQGTGAEADQARNTGSAADHESRNENLLEEPKQLREALLHFGDVPAVELIEPQPRCQEAVKAGRRPLQVVLVGAGLVKDECGEDTDQQCRT